jgi:hypothetical protein
MLDTNVLMIMGLLDNPKIIEMAKEEALKVKIQSIVERCLKNENIRNLIEVDEDFAELFIIAEMSQNAHSR